MEIGHIIPHIEALVFASDRPLAAMDITELINNAFGFMDDKITLEQVSSALDGIIEKYRSEFYPFELRETGGGWQFLTKADYHKTIAQLNGEKYLKRLSGAALETLAIIAYKQPITKADIEAIRGVSSDYSVQKLLEKELIVITGRDENLPGKPLIYTTSKTFMDYFGLNSVDDLPKLKEVFDESVDPTRTNEFSLSVGSSGKLEADVPVENDEPASKASGENPSSAVNEDVPESAVSDSDEQDNSAEESEKPLTLSDENQDDAQANEDGNDEESSINNDALVDEEDERAEVEPGSEDTEEGINESREKDDEDPDAEAL